MLTEFTTFRVIRGKESRALEWMKTLQDRRGECIDTLAREKMGYESVFKIEIDNRLYLSWFTVQGKDGLAVDDSEHEIDKIHCQFWEECIDTDYTPQDHEHVVTFCVPVVDEQIAKVTESETAT